MPKATKNSNQGKLEAAIKLMLEMRYSSLAADVENPDEATPRDVDMTFCIGVKKFAIEHTQIESYPNQIAESVALNKFGELILGQTQDLPAGCVFDLVFRSPLSIDKNSRQRMRIAEKIAKWVSDTVPDLVLRDRDDFESDSKVRNSEICGMQVSLFCNYFYKPSNVSQHGLRIRQYAPTHLKALREKSISRAVSSNNNKLTVRKQSGHYSILLLEDQDISISSHFSVTESLKQIDPNLFPDEIVYADTSTSSWYLISLYRAGNFLPDNELAERYFVYEVSGTR
jgi:hypothetical protein